MRIADSPLGDAVAIDKAVRPTASSVLRFCNSQMEDEDAELAQDDASIASFLQFAAQQPTPTLYEFGMAGFPTFVEWYWEQPRRKFDNDAAIAVGEEAFRAGYKSAADRARAFHPQKIEDDAAHTEKAWSDYEPSEHVKALVE